MHRIGVARFSSDTVTAVPFSSSSRSVVAMGQRHVLTILLIDRALFGQRRRFNRRTILSLCHGKRGDAC